MKSLALACLLAFSAPALAATALEASRAEASRARAHVSELRAKQIDARKQLNELAGRIETLKADRKGKILPGSELDSALKRSQELSGALTELAQSISSAETDAQKDNLALLSTLNGELNRLRADFDRQTDRAARKAMIEQLRSLRSEREQVRAALPATVVPQLENAGASNAGSEDPEDLLEEADAMRDREEKVRREVKQLETRIEEAKQERDLTRRMNDFMRDESLFDESDRRIRLRSEQTQRGAQADTTSAAPPGVNSPQAGSGDFSQKNEAASGAGAPTPTFESHAARASDAHPEIGKTGIAGTDDGDLDQLLIQRERLQGTADELKARAAALEKKAAGVR